MAQAGCLLCAPLIAKTVDLMLQQMHLAKSKGAQVVEFRLDHITDFNSNLDLRALLNSKTLPAIVTYRPKWEGGEYEGGEAPRQAALSLAIELGAEFVDVELQVAAEFIAKQKRTSKTKIIVSNHNWKSTPSSQDIGDLVAKIQGTGADIVKFATTTTNITDVARVLLVLSRSAVPTIALVMGPKGVTSRIPKFQGYLTFGSLGAGLESSPGQPTLQELFNLYRRGRVTQSTKVHGMVGNPVGHSKSPVIRNAAFAETGIDAVYLPFLVDELSEFLREFSVSNFAGFSVTVPYKKAALRCRDEMDSISKVNECTEEERRALRESRFASRHTPSLEHNTRRIAHPGGPMTTNKAAALAKFLERKLQQPGGVASLDLNLVERAIDSAKNVARGSSASAVPIRHVSSFSDSVEAPAKKELGNVTKGEKRQSKSRAKKRAHKEANRQGNKRKKLERGTDD